MYKKSLNIWKRFIIKAKYGDRYFKTLFANSLNRYSFLFVILAFGDLSNSSSDITIRLFFVRVAKSLASSRTLILLYNRSMSINSTLLMELELELPL